MGIILFWYKILIPVLLNLHFLGAKSGGFYPNKRTGVLVNSEVAKWLHPIAVQGTASMRLSCSYHCKCWNARQAIAK